MLRTKPSAQSGIVRARARNSNITVFLVEVCSIRIMPKKKARKKNKSAQELSKLGAKKGGIARAKALSSRQRIDSARKAAEARWAKWRRDRGL